MKKKLEAELVSIAHRILQIKNKSDVNQLLIETQKLHEKLSVLKFVEDNFGEAKPTIGQAEMIEKIDLIFEEIPSPEIEKEINDEISIENEVVVDEIEEEEINALEKETDGFEEVEEQISDNIVEETKIDFEPVFEIETKTEVETKNQPVQISFEDLLGVDYKEANFVKLDEAAEIEELSVEKVYQEELKTESFSAIENSNGIQIDLTDKVSFIKNLFENSDEDYTRVINQLITYDNFEEAKNFINEMVKPDYNDWQGKESFEAEFLAMIEKKFS